MVESCSFFFFKQKTAYEMRISDWSSDVCSSDLPTGTSPPKSPLLSDPPDLFFVTQIFPHRCILQCYTTSDRKPSLHHIKTWVQKEGHCGRQRRSDRIPTPPAAVAGLFRAPARHQTHSAA